MSEDQHVFRREFMGRDTSGTCGLCGLNVPRDELTVVRGEEVGLTGTEQVHVCTECYQQIGQADYVPVDDSEPD